MVDMTARKGVERPLLDRLADEAKLWSPSPLTDLLNEAIAELTAAREDAERERARAAAAEAALSNLQEWKRRHQSDTCDGFMVGDPPHYEPACVVFKEKLAEAEAALGRERERALVEAAKVCDRIEQDVRHEADKADEQSAYASLHRKANGAASCAAHIRALLPAAPAAAEGE